MRPAGNCYAAGVMHRAYLLAALTVTATACGDDGPAAIDARAIDAHAIDAMIDAPPGPCGAEVQLTGEYIDWDSTLAVFDGVENAVWQIPGGRMATTAPNGRIILCIPAGAVSQIDVTQPDYLPARVVADPAVVGPAGGTFSVRGLKRAMAAAQFTEFGVTFDPAAAQVLIYKVGAAIPLVLLPAVAPSEGTFVSDGSDDITWAEGSTGKLTLFPNRPVGAGTATLSSTSAFIGPTALPLAAGRFTIAIIR